MHLGLPRLGIPTLGGGGVSSNPMTELLAALQTLSGANPTLFYPILPGYCWQDTARTVPAGKDDPVRVYDDIGGGNHHMIASADGRRGILREAGGLWYIETDGTDDAYATAATVDFSGTDKISVFGALRKLSDAATAIFLEFSVAAASQNGSFYLSAPETSAGNFRVLMRGTVSNAPSSVSSAAPVTAVLTIQGDIAAPLVRMRLDGVQVVNNTGSLGTGAFGNHRLFHAARNDASLRFTGHTYGYAKAGGFADADLIAQAEAYFASRCGVTL